MKHALKLQCIKGTNRLELPVQDLPEGIYLLRLTGAGLAIGKTVIVGR